MASINAVVKALCRQHTALHETSSGDVAHSWPYDLIWTALLGLTDDETLIWPVDTEECEYLEDDFLDACRTLQNEDYPELADRLRVLRDQWNTCTSCSVLGLDPRNENLVEISNISGGTNQSLLAFLCQLRGSCHSFRHRKTTFQALVDEHTSTSVLEKPSSLDKSINELQEEREDGIHFYNACQERDSKQERRYAKSLYMAHLGTDIFDEAPDPSALVDGCSKTTSVLLPEEVECGMEKGMIDDRILALGNEMSGRPKWCLGSTDTMTTQFNIASRLDGIAARRSKELGKKEAVLPQLQVAMSNLYMDHTPGKSTTLFSQNPQNIENHGISSEGGGDAPRVTAEDTPPIDYLGKQIGQSMDGRKSRHFASKCDHIADENDNSLFERNLWSDQDIQMAHDAFLTIKGVRVSLLKLQGILEAGPVLSCQAQLSLLKSIVDTGKLRQLLQHFVVRFFKNNEHSQYPVIPLNAHATYSNGTHTSKQHESEEKTEKVEGFYRIDRDPVLRAFSGGVSEVLQCLDSELDSMDIYLSDKAIANGNNKRDLVPSETIRMHTGHGQQAGMSLSRICIVSKKVQRKIKYLASLCWLENLDESQVISFGSEESNDSDFSPLSGIPLLEYLYSETHKAEGDMETLTSSLFYKALHPYISSIFLWAFTPEDSDLIRVEESGLNLPVHAGGMVDLTNSRNANFLEKETWASIRTEPQEPCLPVFLKHLQEPLRLARYQLKLLSSVDLFGAKMLTDSIIEFQQKGLQFMRDYIGNLQISSFSKKNTCNRLMMQGFVSSGNSNHPRNIASDNQKILLQAWPDSMKPYKGKKFKNADTPSLKECYSEAEPGYSPLTKFVDNWIDSLLDKDNYLHFKESLLSIGPENKSYNLTAKGAINSYDFSNLARSDTLTKILSYHVHAQSFALSRACIALLFGPLNLDLHLKLLRQVYFLENAGDWGESFLSMIHERITELQPFGSHDVHSLLQSSISASCLGDHEVSDHLEMHILSGTDAQYEVKRGLESHSQGKKFCAKAPRSYSMAPAMLEMYSFESLDRLYLEYHVSWPLSAILTEDILTCYSAMWNAMMRVRWVCLNLKKLKIAMTDRKMASTSGKGRYSNRDSEFDGNMYSGQFMCMNIFIHYAGVFLAALQEFQNLTTQESCWRQNFKPIWNNDCLPHEVFEHVQQIIDSHETYLCQTAHGCLQYYGHKSLQDAVESLLKDILRVIGAANSLLEKDPLLFSNTNGTQNRGSWSFLKSCIDKAYSTMQHAKTSIQNLMHTRHHELPALLPLYSWAEG